MSASKFLAGAITGLVAGLLLAPDKGENTRQRIADAAEKWRDKLNHMAGNMSIGLDDLRDFLEQDIAGLSEDVRNRILTIINEAEEMAYDPSTTGTAIGNSAV